MKKTFSKRRSTGNMVAPTLLNSYKRVIQKFSAAELRQEYHLIQEKKSQLTKNNRDFVEQLYKHRKLG